MEQASILEGYQTYGKHSEEEQKKQGVFDIKAEPAASYGVDMVDQLRNISRRLRILEERYANQRKNLQVFEHNFISENKKLQSQQRILQADIDDIKKQLYEMKQRFDIMGAELQDTAKRQDVVVLEKYINLWEPINFVTRNEVEKLINFILENKKKRTETEEKK